MRTFIVGTAGHIDHGKSTLVRALTGTDPDRLKEEKERGITTDLGFAHTDLGQGVVASFIDVPGHERFVRNMLAGAFGIDAVVLVVASDESVMPQTREHFHICRLLGVPRGLVVLTKSDASDPDRLSVAELEARELVRAPSSRAGPSCLSPRRRARGLRLARGAPPPCRREPAARVATRSCACPWTACSPCMASAPSSPARSWAGGWRWAKRWRCCPGADGCGCAGYRCMARTRRR